MARASTKRRAHYTDEERAEREQRNRDIRAGGTADLHDPETVRRRIEEALSAGLSPRMMRYSLRNLLLLLRQAEQRGIVLRDVNTLKGWRRYGRKVRRGETGLRIIRPVGAADEDGDDSAANDAGDADHSDGDTAATTRPRFRMASRFDISQTDPIDFTSADGDDPAAPGAACAHCAATTDQPCMTGCACLGCTGGTGEQAPEEIPADVLWNSLQEQLDRAGYQFDWPADPADLHGVRVRFDHDTRTVHVAMSATAAHPGALADLAVGLADVLTRAEDAARQAREERQQARAQYALTAAPSA